MATRQVILGDTVNYVLPGDVSLNPLAAAVLGVSADGTTADLRIDGGYCRGTMDIARVTQSAAGAAQGMFFYPVLSPITQVADIVNYQAPAAARIKRAYAAMVVAVRGAVVDLLIFREYCQSAQYQKGVSKAADALNPTADTFFVPTATPNVAHLGSIVNFRVPKSVGSFTVAGVVIDLAANGSATIRVANVYAQAHTDITGVFPSATSSPGTYYLPRGLKGAGRLNLPLNDTTDTTVALMNGSDAGAVNDLIQIHDEYMTIKSVISANNYSVSRAAVGSQIVPHVVGAVVRIGVPAP